MIAIEDLSQGDTQHLPALVEHRLYHTTEELFIAAKVSHLITGHTDHGTLYLRRWLEHTWLYGKEILHMIPSLNQYRQNAILLITRLRGHAHSHLVLNHTCTTWDQILIVEHLEKNLRGDIIGIVARQDELLTVEHLVQIHPQEISTYYIIREARIMLLKIGHRLTVDLHYLERPWLLNEKLRHHAHTWSYFENGDFRTGIYGIGYRLGNIQVGQEMLTEVLLGSYLFHGCKININRVINQINNKKRRTRFTSSPLLLCFLYT